MTDRRKAPPQPGSPEPDSPKSGAARARTASSERPASRDFGHLRRLWAFIRPYRLRVHDPVVPASAARHPRAEGADSPALVCGGADALVIMTPWAAFRDLAPDEIARSLRGLCVIDPYAVLDGAACRRSGLDYHTLGVADA